MRQTFLLQLGQHERVNAISKPVRLFRSRHHGPLGFAEGPPNWFRSGGDRCEAENNGSSINKQKPQEPRTKFQIQKTIGSWFLDLGIWAFGWWHGGFLDRRGS